MGILYPISKHINDLLMAHHLSKKPDWSMSAATLRALRFSQAYLKNSKAIDNLNKLHGCIKVSKKAVEQFREHPPVDEQEDE